MAGNHGSSNRELTDYSGCEEKRQLSQNGLRAPTSSSWWVFLLLGWSFLFGWFCLFILILIISFKLIKVLKAKLYQPYCLEDCYQLRSQTAAPGRQQGVGISCQNIIPHPSAALYILSSVSSFMSSFKEVFTFLEAWHVLCPTLGHLHRASRLLFITFPNVSWVRLTVKTGNLSLLYLEQVWEK